MKIVILSTAGASQTITSFREDSEVVFGVGDMVTVTIADGRSSTHLVQGQTDEDLTLSPHVEKIDLRQLIIKQDWPKLEEFKLQYAKERPDQVSRITKPGHHHKHVKKFKKKGPMR